VFTIIGLANLQAGDKIEKIQRKGVDVVIALDVSKSMLATDIQPNRLTRAQQLIMTLADKMQNDRVALIVFAGRSYLQVPLTVDYTALRMMVQNVSVDMVPTQGTVIGEAVDMAVQSFSQKELKYKSLIIISDGEDHDEAAIKKVEAAAQAGVVVHTVGIGSPQGTTLYDPETKSVKLDENGSPVISKLNEGELRSLAAAGHGTYSLLQNTNDVAGKLISNLDDMEQKNLGSVVYTDYTSYFQYFLLVSLLAFLAEWLIPGAKPKRIKQKDTTTKNTPVKKAVATIAGIVLALILPALALAQNHTNLLLQKGNRLYDEKRYDEATANYLQALKKDPGNATGLFNLGNTMYQKKQYDSSRKLMNATADAIKDKNGKSAAHYNIGNTYMAQRKWEEAIAAYKKTLRNNPQDADAKYNLSYAQEMLKKQQQQDKQKQDQQNKDKQQQDKDKKDKDKKDKQDQQKDSDNDKQDKQEQQPQSQQSKLTEQQAEQLLNALQQQEKKLQDKLKKEKGTRVKMDKDW
jgi:Ca-activated chloride channel family protein